MAFRGFCIWTLHTYCNYVSSLSDASTHKTGTLDLTGWLPGKMACCVFISLNAQQAIFPGSHYELRYSCLKVHWCSSISPSGTWNPCDVADCIKKLDLPKTFKATIRACQCSAPAPRTHHSHQRDLRSYIKHRSGIKILFLCTYYSIAIVKHPNFFSSLLSVWIFCACIYITSLGSGAELRFRAFCRACDTTFLLFTRKFFSSSGISKSRRTSSSLSELQNKSQKISLL